MKPIVRIGLWVVLIVLFVAFYQFFSHDAGEVQHVTWSKFQELVEQGQVKGVEVKGDRYRVRTAGSDDRIEATGPRPDQALLQSLREAGVDVALQAEESEGMWARILSQWFPVLFVMLLFVWFMRSLRGKTVTD